MEIITKNMTRMGIFNCFRYLSLSSRCSSKENVFVQKHKNVTMISINRPSKRNSLDSETFSRILSKIQDFEDDSDAKVAILNGEGGNFCSGFDMEEIIDKGYDSLLQTIGNMGERPLCKKPIIAAVSGFAVAEGFELALACDLRVIEDTASIGVLGRRFGAPMLLGGATRLSQLVGSSRAMDLILTGRIITGAIANEWGLAARCVNTGTALGQSLNLAISIAKFPINGLIHDKLSIYETCLADKKEWIAQNEQDLITLKAASIKDIESNAIKFREGIGRHGKAKNISPKEATSWEIEDDIEREKMQ